MKDEGFEVSEKIGQLKLMAEDGKLRLTDCTNTKNMFRGFIENKEAAKEGGTVAGVARKELEQRSIRKVSTPKNYLSVPEKKKKLKGT